MKRNKLFVIVSLIVALTMVLTSCTKTTLDIESIPEGARRGGWLDEIVVSVVSADSAVTQLQAGAIDIFAAGLSSADVPAIEAAGLESTKQAGLYYDILFNPAEFTTGEFNPFVNRKIREAINWLVDRTYLNQEVYAGGGLEKFFAITTQFPDYADLADKVRELESYYAYNPDKAIEVIKAEMEGMGATLGSDGKWQANGKPVTLIFLIRPDSDGTRQPLGDYFANQLETAGFTVDRQYKKSSEAGPIWQGEAAAGQWHLYTAAWSATIIDRDQRNIFQEMYLPSSAQGLDAMLQNKADPEFQDIGDRLANGDFKDLAERRELMKRALELSLQDSLQLFLIDGKQYVPYVKGVSVTADLAAGVEGAQVWPLTIRRVGEEGGQLKWGTSDVFTEPWNPVAGSNWAWDQAVIRATSSGDQLYDPFTGLIWPMRIEKAEVTVLKDATVGTTLDWVTLNFADEIKVPADAFVDWDATAQKWITAGEKFPDGLTAKRKSVATYPADLFKTVKWHDGSYLSMGDIMLSLIYTFDRGKPESMLYDEVYAPSFDAFLETFKGFKIVSTDPFVYEYYSDNFVADAELNVGSPWPNYGFGEGSWPIIALGTKAEEKGELAYSIDKAGTLEIEQMSFIGGPSLEILTADLEEAIEEKYLPYAPTMSQYVPAKEIKARYAAVKAFYEKLGHYWIGTGPYYVAKPMLTEKILTLKAYRNYPDLSSRWDQFKEPKLATVALTGPSDVKIGGEAAFDVAVTFKGAAYPTSEIKEVKYMVYNSKGEMIKLDVAEAVADGQYKVVLPADLTKGLEAGTNKLEVAVIPLPVSIPAFTSIPFVTAP